MPKLIDHSQRRTEIGEAAWRVILRDGIGAASVRSVAAEAGVSAGSLRHLFPSQEQLVAFSMQLVDSKVRARVAELPLGLPPRELALRVAEELIPLDANRRAEVEVSLALDAQASSDPALQKIRNASHAAIGYACRQIIELTVSDNSPTPRPGRAKTPDLDIKRESRRLHALIDGLSAHLTYEPAGSDPTWAREILADHLDEIAER
ncbi:MAG: hypothetical protein JWQ43_1543 [Glaciihabitans sp.]|nr:hypothetical protein [Glaciihabitans sp.]